MIRVAIFALWMLHFLPLALLNPIGRGLGLLFYALGRERREVARINMQLCFPALSECEREYRVRQHFRAFGRSFLERGILWWSSAARIKRLVHIEGEAHWQALHGQPVILLAPHFVGLDMGGSRLSIEVQVASMYSKQKNPLVDRLLLQGRRRFNIPCRTGGYWEAGIERDYHR